MEMLRVRLGIPAAPFAGEHGGLDVDLVQALAEKLGVAVEFVAAEAEHDCATGTPGTSEQEKQALLLPPYVISGQALAVDTRRLPHVRSVEDLAGLTIGVLRGGTSQQFAERLVADGKAGAVRLYDHDGIGTALTSETCDALIALEPVLAALERPVEVVQRGLTVEEIAIAVSPGDQALVGRLTVAQAELEADGTLQEIRRKWLGNPYADQSLAAH
ncbi:ABC transporter substrate-binding protein [Mycobacterium sp. E740]|uniref:ABC transporter substrate-binding protein n=1 Tax=Mycobacterium sp. E740 TaxID=1834149 RepID=UPI0007FC819D|nr:ABC transporter substrate-binding protein [Mycobacterium sp. E740]OBI83603.1 ABC transporter substrate-binding protein [Mycobacterium sp. E740]